MVTSLSIVTDSNGVLSTSTGTSTSTAAASKSNKSTSSTGKTWGIVGGVIGVRFLELRPPFALPDWTSNPQQGVVLLLGIVFVVYRMTQRRFGNLDDDGDEIRWPELQPDGQTIAAGASTLNPLGTRRTGRAGVEMSERDGSEWGGDGDVSGGGLGGAQYHSRASSYEPVQYSDNPNGSAGPEGAYCQSLKFVRLRLPFLIVLRVCRRPLPRPLGGALPSTASDLPAHALPLAAAVLKLGLVVQLCAVRAVEPDVVLEPRAADAPDGPVREPRGRVPHSAAFRPSHEHSPRERGRRGAPNEPREPLPLRLGPRGGAAAPARRRQRRRLNFPAYRFLVSTPRFDISIPSSRRPSPCIFIDSPRFLMVLLATRLAAERTPL